MNPASAMERERADGEATRWLIRLAEAEGDAALYADFEAWRAKTPINAESWERARAAYDLIGQREPSHAEHWHAYAARRRARRALPQGRRAPRAFANDRRGPSFPSLPALWRFAGLGAVAAVVLAIAVLLPGILLRLDADIVTGTGEVRSVTLQEGSTVGLGPESALALGFGDGERRVRLIRGEAFFEVLPDATRPFRVEAGDAVVTVVGTAFEVRLTDRGVFVAVQEGRVRVDKPRAPAAQSSLQAGQWIDMPREGAASRGTLKQDDVAPWRTGKLIALNRPAGEVVDDMRRYYPGAIVVQSQAFAQRQVSGIYDLTNPARTLRDLASAHSGRVRELSDWLLVITSE